METRLKEQKFVKMEKKKIPSFISDLAAIYSL